MGKPLSVVISGYYGFKNSGDEAVLQAIIYALREHASHWNRPIQITVLSADPEWTKMQYQVDAVSRMSPFAVIRAIRQADGLISGGGSLLQDVTGWKTIPYYLGVLKLAQWLGKPTFIYSQGIGPVQRRIFDGLIAAVFAKCAGITVRDPESAAYLHHIGISAERVVVVPDPVMGLTGNVEGQVAELIDLTIPVAVDHPLMVSEQENRINPPVVGVSVRHWETDFSDLIKIGQGLALLANQMPQVTFKILPFHQPSDAAASATVCDVMLKSGVEAERIGWVTDALNPLEMMAHVQACDVLVGMRLHALIYSATRFVPCAGISYDPKIGRFLEQIGETPAGTTSDLQPEKLAEQLTWLIRNRDLWITEKRGQILHLQEQARVPAGMIVEGLR